MFVVVALAAVFVAVMILPALKPGYGTNCRGRPPEYSTATQLDQP
jgi:hypothetical protein